MYVNTLDPFLRKNCDPLISNQQALIFSIGIIGSGVGVSLHGTVSEHYTSRYIGQPGAVQTRVGSPGF